MFLTRWMYDVSISHLSFQPMIDAIGQYDVSIKGQNFYEVRVTNLKKELTLTKDLMKHHMVEWQKKKKKDVQSY